jgi:hypothetical protein
MGMDNIRADAYRRVATQHFKWLIAILIVIVAWLFGWWALLPAIVALQTESAALALSTLTAEL